MQSKHSIVVFTGDVHFSRCVVPTLFEALAFRCHNELHRPMMLARERLERYRDRPIMHFPLTAGVPLKGFAKEAWRDLVLDNQTGWQQ